MTPYRGASSACPATPPCTLKASNNTYPPLCAVPGFMSSGLAQLRRQPRVPTLHLGLGQGRQGMQAGMQGLTGEDEVVSWDPGSSCLELQAVPQRLASLHQNTNPCIADCPTCSVRCTTAREWQHHLPAGCLVRSSIPAPQPLSCHFSAKRVGYCSLRLFPKPLACCLPFRRNCDGDTAKCRECDWVSTSDHGDGYPLYPSPDGRACVRVRQHEAREGGGCRGPARSPSLLLRSLQGLELCCMRCAAGLL